MFRTHLVSNLGRKNQNLANAQAVWLSIGHDRDLALNDLNRDRSRSPVLADACAGFEREQRDCAIAMLVQRLLSVAMGCWSLRTNRGRFRGKIKDQ